MAKDQKNKKKILLVEDEQDLRELYVELLTDSGFEVVSVTDGLEAVKLLSDETWDLLLLDIMLPGIDGLKILKKISAGELTKKGSIVVITNFSTDYIAKEAFKHGADAVLFKADCDPDGVVREVERWSGLA